MRRPLAALLLATTLTVACTPGQARVTAPDEPSGQASNSTSRPAAHTAHDPLQLAETVLAREIGPSLDATVASLQFTAGLIQVTLNRPTTTLGDADLYARVCNALRGLIDPAAAPNPVLGVQTFRADGSAVVSSAAADAPCGRFYR